MRQRKKKKCYRSFFSFIFHDVMDGSVRVERQTWPCHYKYLVNNDHLIVADITFQNYQVPFLCHGLCGYCVQSETEINRTECVQKNENENKNNKDTKMIFEGNILQATCKVAQSSSTVFDCGQNNPAICESHLTYHANMFGLCKLGLMPFKQVRTIK